MSCQFLLILMIYVIFYWIFSIIVIISNMHYTKQHKSHKKTKLHNYIIYPKTMTRHSYSASACSVWITVHMGLKSMARLRRNTSLALSAVCMKMMAFAICWHRLQSQSVCTNLRNGSLTCWLFAISWRSANSIQGSIQVF